MSQKIRLQILRCVVILKVFSKKRSVLVQKTRPLLLSETILNAVRRPGTICSTCRMLLVGMILLLPAKNKQNRPSVHNQPVRQLRCSTTLRPRLHDGPVRLSWKGAGMPLAYITCPRGFPPSRLDSQGAQRPCGPVCTTSRLDS
jgi:hypothetical protein